jgi:hypothetical protein
MSKKTNNVNKIKSFKISDTLVIIISIFLLFLLFILQADIWTSLFHPSNLYLSIIENLKIFVLNWLVPFTALILAVMTYRNIALTKESIKLSEDTLKQMQLADQKNTSPMLSFTLNIGEQILGAYIIDEERPREIKLWNAKADATESNKPHFLNLSLKNVQEHPQGVAIAVSLTINLEFPICEGTGETKVGSEDIVVNWTYMDAGENYEQSIMKISGIPSLTARINKISYKDMFNQQYVIGYGLGILQMKKPYLPSRSFVSLVGKTPDEV